MNPFRKNDLPKASEESVADYREKMAKLPRWVLAKDILHLKVIDTKNGAVIGESSGNDALMREMVEWANKGLLIDS